MEWTGYDRVFGMEDPMKSSKMIWRRQSFQWIVLDATGPRSCDWLRKEKKPFDDLWLHGVMPCKVPCRMCDRMCRASPIDLTGTIRYNSIHIFHIFHFCFPCSKNSKTRRLGRGPSHRSHSVADLASISQSSGLLHRAALSGLALPQILPLQIVNLPYRFVSIYNICSVQIVRHLWHLWHWQVTSKVWTCSVGAWSGCRTSRIACSSTGQLSSIFMLSLCAKAKPPNFYQEQLQQNLDLQSLSWKIKYKNIFLQEYSLLVIIYCRIIYFRFLKIIRNIIILLWFNNYKKNRKKNKKIYYY